jgi:predicted KAP-like P-loop ATPase
VVEIMEEYISKNKLMKFLDNLRQPKNQVHPAWLTKGFKYITIDAAIRVVSERPPEDVVEREKIDKAIKEIEELISHSKLPTVNTYNRYSDGLKDCLEILKRNIGDGKSVDTSPIK